MASDDPDFERKAADVIGLYVNPRSTPRCSVSTKDCHPSARSPHPVLPLALGGPSATARSIGTARSRSTLRSTPKRQVLRRPPPAIPPRVVPSRQLAALQPKLARSTSSPTTSRPIRPSGRTVLGRSSQGAPAFTPPIPLAQSGRTLVRPSNASLARGSSPRQRPARKLMRYIRHTTNSRPINGPTATSLTESSLLLIQLYRH